MRTLLMGMGVAAALLAGTPASEAGSIIFIGPAYAQEGCLSWGDARNAGWIEQFNLKDASDIKATVETKYKGKVVNFVLCPKDNSVIYSMTVYQANGNVLFVQEPAQ